MENRTDKIFVLKLDTKEVIALTGKTSEKVLASHASHEQVLHDRTARLRKQNGRTRLYKPRLVTHCVHVKNWREAHKYMNKKKEFTSDL